VEIHRHLISDRYNRDDNRIDKQIEMWYLRKCNAVRRAPRGLQLVLQVTQFRLINTWIKNSEYSAVGNRIVAAQNTVCTLYAAQLLCCNIRLAPEFKISTFFYMRTHHRRVHKYAKKDVFTFRACRVQWNSYHRVHRFFRLKYYHKPSLCYQVR